MIDALSDKDFYTLWFVGVMVLVIAIGWLMDGGDK